MIGGGSSQGDDLQGGRPLREAVGLDSRFEPLVALVRGSAVESIHRGAVAVVGVDGDLLGGAGDPAADVVLRSTAKPFQAAAVVGSGAAEAFALTDEDIAVMAASHVAAPEHVAVVRRLLERGGIPAGALVCGSLEHMCSGKHAGMLLLARHLGAPLVGYEREDHLVQKEVAGYVSSLLARRPRPDWVRAGAGATGPGTRTLFVGRDGCGVPVMRTTLQEAAWLYALLAAGATPVLARVRDAMMAHPDLVAGDGRLDTQVMTAAPGLLVAKGGAEGVQGIGLFPGDVPGGPDVPVGCVMKIEDGSARPMPVLVVRFLEAWALDQAAEVVERCHPRGVAAANGGQAGSLEVLVAPAHLRRRRAAAGGRPARPTGDSAAGPESVPVDSRTAGVLSWGRREERVSVCRGDEKDVRRFLREQWPAVDEEVLGRMVDWSAEPYCLVFRRDKKIVAALRGHFIGGLASVDELMVGEGSRGSGLGSLLLGRFEEEARSRGSARIAIRAVKGSSAEDFYRGRGYHRECVQHGYEFGFDYVRLTRLVEHTLEENEGLTRQEKGGR